MDTYAVTKFFLHKCHHIENLTSKFWNVIFSKYVQNRKLRVYSLKKKTDMNMIWQTECKRFIKQWQNIHKGDAYISMWCSWVFGYRSFGAGCSV